MSTILELKLKNLKKCKHGEDNVSSNSKQSHKHPFECSMQIYVYMKEKKKKTKAFQVNK